MNDIEKDKIFAIYNDNNLKELVKIIKDKSIGLNDVTNAFGESIIQYFIEDQKYDLLSITLKHQQKCITNPTQLLTDLFNFEKHGNKKNIFDEKTEQNKIRDLLYSANTLIFHPLTSFTSKLITNISVIQNITDEYPTVLDYFLDKNKIKLNEMKKFLEALINTKLDSSMNKINFKSEIQHILEKKILEHTITKTNINKTIPKV